MLPRTCGSGSCSRIAKLWVFAGAFIHWICGDTPDGALLQENFTGSSVPSLRSGIIIMSGGGGGAFFWSWAKLLAGTNIAAQIKNVFISTCSLRVIVL